MSIQFNITIYNIMHDKQYSFTKGRSTTDAGIGLLRGVTVYP